MSLIGYPEWAFGSRSSGGGGGSIAGQYSLLISFVVYHVSQSYTAHHPLQISIDR
jgi:hypothetical protein